MPSEKILEKKKQQVAELAESLKGACTGVIVDYKGISVSDDKEDYVAGAKILCGFADKSKDIFNVKAGFVDGNVVDAKGVKELAELPPKEVLVAKALGGLNAPITGFVTVLNGTMKGLVVALNALAEKKGAEA